MKALGSPRDKLGCIIALFCALVSFAQFFLAPGGNKPTECYRMAAVLKGNKEAVR